MRALLGVWIVVATLPGSGTAPVVAAQAKTSTAESSKSDTPLVHGPEPAATTVAEVQPEIFYLKDKDGKLVPLLNHSVEEIRELLELRNNLLRAATPRPFIIDNLQITGRINGERAELDLDFAITTTSDGWKRIPLGLAPAVAREAAAYTGPGQHILDVDPRGAGYVSWIHSSGRGEHRVRLKVVAQVAVDGDARRLKFQAPRDVAVSKLKLLVPQRGVTATTTEGNHVLRSTAVSGGVEFELERLGPNFELTWSPPGTGSMSMARVAVDTADVVATIDAQGVRWDAQLTIRAIAGPLESFAVRLPLGAELQPLQASGLQATTRMEGGVQVADIRAGRPSPTVSLRLTARRGRDAQQSATPIELAGFEVLGAIRQSGRLLVSVDGDWRIEWLQQRDIRELDQPPDGMDAELDQIVAAFEYFAQPYSLVMRAEPQRSRVTAEPTYVVVVERDRVTLEAAIRYTVRGAKLSRLQVQMPGWSIDDVGPASLVREDIDIDAPDGLVTVPLAQPQRGALEFVIKAHRELPPDANQIDLPLPRPRVDAAAGATVIVQPADNVELTPQTNLTRGLVRLTSAPTPRLPKREQPPLVYRQLGGKDECRFVSEFRVHTRRITAESSVTATLNDQGGSVEQSIAYAVDYEPVDRLVLEMPRILALRRDAKFALDGVEISNPTVDSSSLPPGGNEYDVARCSVPLGKNLVGRGVLTIKFALLRSSAGSGAIWTIPLVMPAEGELASNHLRLMTRPEVSCTVDGQQWAIAGRSPMPLRPGVMEFAAKDRAARATVRLQAPPPATVVQRAWIQTWFSGPIRQDRIVYNLSSNETELALTFPEGVRREAAAVWLDGRPSSLRWVGAGTGRQCLIDLSDARPTSTVAPAYGPPRDRVLEVLYTMDAGRRGPGDMAMQAVQLPESAWVLLTLWQIVLPQDEHLIAHSEEYAPEYSWKWYPALHIGDFPIISYWGRQSRLDQADLRQLTAASQADLAVGKTNRYLFSRLGAPDGLHFRSAGRSAIVLTMSGLALLVGLLLLTVPALRHPLTGLTVSVMLLAAAFWSPAVTFLALQASAAGIGLAILAMVLRYVVGLRRHRRTSWRGAMAPRAERKSTHPSPLRDDSPSQVTTQTAPAPVE